MAGRGFRRPGTIVCGLRHNSLFEVDLKVEGVIQDCYWLPRVTPWQPIGADRALWGGQ